MTSNRFLLSVAGSLFACALAESPAAADVERHQYRGQLVQQDVGGGSVPVRAFGLVAWVERMGDQATTLYRVDDDGRGALPWWDSIGRAVSVNAESPRPRMRHVHLGRPYTLTLPGPLAAAPTLQLDSTFDLNWDGRPTTFTVTGEQRVGNRDCWTVAGDSGNGRRQTWLVDKSSHLIVRAAARVFIGQGERFELQLELEPGDSPPAEQLTRELTQATQLLDLRDSLNLGDATAEELDAPQLAQVAAALPAFTAAAQGTSWERFVQSVSAATSAQQERSAAIEKLAQQIIGRPAPEGTLLGLDGQPLPWRSTAGEVVVLHFWDYRGTPESPFGQVGYLDFLAGKFQGRPVHIYGVAVDERAAEPQQLRQVQREIKKFSTEFIRIGYPIGIDDGRLLRQLGDPRPLNTPLPLWIVIGPDGKVSGYRTGLYTLDPQRGLTELHDAITRLLNSR